MQKQSTYTMENIIIIGISGIAEASYTKFQVRYKYGSSNN